MNYKELREAAGWTQVQAAIACGVAVVTWRLWESGGGQPNEENMARVRAAFNLEGKK